MPKQHVLFGRPVPRFAPRRIALLLAMISVLAVFTLVLTLPSSIPAGPSLSAFADHKFSIPKIKGSGTGWTSALNPFRPPSHAPPRQDNDTHAGSSWHADWKWLSIPFSSSVTLDESRALLPPLPERPPVYCYYDTTVEKDAASRDAESALLLTWRRAWWAQGFRPVILSAAEAMNNPMYEELQRLDGLDPAMRTDMMRWLAWENMGGGLLAHYLLFPMGKHEDPLLGFLRRGKYPALTRWEGLRDGLFAGPRADVTAAVKLVMEGVEIKAAKDFVSAVPRGLEKDPFKVEDVTADYSLAFYDAETVATKYGKVAEALEAGRAGGLLALDQLVNAHLHITWQNVFADGIAVLKPLPKHTTHMVQPALELAERLAQCSETPMPSSCPPNLPRCAPCVAKHPMKISTPPHYRNASAALYTIGTVPHPYTLQTLDGMRDALDVPWIRRQSPRDAWVFAVTKELLGTGVSGGPRVLRFKEAVAGNSNGNGNGNNNGDYDAAAHSLWLAAEEPVPDDLDWRFGFAIPRPGMDTGRSETPVPGPERRPPPPERDPQDGPLPSPEDLKREASLLARALKVGKSRDRRELALRDAVEAWNLADTEAWKFARAFLARASVERLGWETEEARYAGGVGSEKGQRRQHQGSTWARWLDTAGGEKGKR